MRAALLLLVLVACGDPPFTLKFRITKGDSYACKSETGVTATKCSDVTFSCPAVASIRVLPPGDPTAPFISMCRELTRMDACGIAGIDLKAPDQPVPAQRLLVEIALYPKYLLPTDDNGEPICPPPTHVPYAADGYPIAQAQPCDAQATDPMDPQFCWPSPAIGGSAYYTPGDTETVVDLGCTDPGEFTSPMCSGPTLTAVTASIDDFDQPIVSVPSATAQRLEVKVGEPAPNGSEYVLGTMMSPEEVLAETSGSPPHWESNVDLMFSQYACLDVLEDVPLTTATATCKRVANPTSVDLLGYRMSNTTLAQVLRAIDNQSPSSPPFTLDKGLVIGMVVDANGQPLSGAKVDAGVTATIEYLSDNRTSFITGGTSLSGMFISRDAPFGTSFTATDMNSMKDTELGGLIDNKVTIVILQPTPPSN